MLKSKLRNLTGSSNTYSCQLILLLIILSLAESCSDGQYLLNGNCYKCLYICKTCVNGYSCASCNDGYFNFADNVCLSCAQYPSYCPTASAALSKGAIAGIVVASVILIVIIIVVVYKVRQYWLEDQQPNQHMPTSMDIARPQQDAAHQQQLKKASLKIFDQICPICLQKGNCRTKCGHIFHPLCLAELVNKNQACPICQVEIRQSYSCL